jgi:hypothetical protein
MNLMHLLLQRAREEKLAHFYIVESSLPHTQGQGAVREFVESFIREYFKEVEKSPVASGHELKNHPDIFIMGETLGDEEKKNADYLVEEAQQMIRFFELRPVQSRRKFAVIPEAERVSTVVANKWLKLLEAPSGEATIFLLNPSGKKFIDTIHSRAQHLRVPSTQRPQAGPQALMDFLTQAHKLSLAPFIEKNLKQPQDVWYWTQLILEWEAQQEDHIQAKIALTEWVKKLEEMETFHQPAATKWTLFYSYLQLHLLPRITR